MSAKCTIFSKMFIIVANFKRQYLAYLWPYRFLIPIFSFCTIFGWFPSLCPPPHPSSLSPTHSPPFSIPHPSPPPLPFPPFFPPLTLLSFLLLPSHPPTHRSHHRVAVATSLEMVTSDGRDSLAFHFAQSLSLSHSHTEYKLSVFVSNFVVCNFVRCQGSATPPMNFKQLYLRAQGFFLRSYTNGVHAELYLCILKVP